MAQPSALRVVQGSGLQGNNYNPQGNNYNPQPTAPSTVLQNTAPARALQPAAPIRYFHPAYRAVPSKRETEAAAAALRQRVEEEAARQKLIVRQQVQQKVDLAVATNRSEVVLDVAKAKNRINFVGFRNATPRVDLVEDPDKARLAWTKAFARASKEFDDRTGNLRDFNLWEGITGGKQAGAREWAQQKLTEVSDRLVPEYSTRLNTFLDEQAKRKHAIESSKFGTRAQFDKAVAEYSAWEAQNINSLEESRSEIEGYYDAYSQFSTREVNALLPNIGKAFQKAVANPVGNFLGGVWKYTLGEGDENIPSLVTAPSRLINTVGNAMDPNRTVYRYDGSEGQLDKSKNAWQQSFAQRNFNIAPVKAQPFDQWIRTKQTQDNTGKSQSLVDWINTLPESKREAELAKYRKLYDNENRANTAANNTAEFFADPLFASSGLKALKIPEAVGKSTFAQRFGSSAPIQAMRDFTESVKNTKLVKWLGAEAKSPQQRLVDAVTNAKILQADAQKILPRVAALQKRLTGKPDLLDYGVFDDLASLTDKEAKLLQKMVGGKLGKGAWFQRGAFRDPVLRDKLERVAERWKNFSDKLAEADKIRSENSRFLEPSGRQYFARTNWVKNKKGQTLDAYDFRLKKTKPNYVQTAQDLHQSQIDRLFKSDLEAFAAKNANMSQKRARAELQELLSRYDKTMDTARADVESALAKTKTPYGRARGFLDRFGPTALWKKSVLKYRPAWYVNNFLYNTQAAVLAGGRRAVGEQTRLLLPKNFRKAASEVPEGVKSNIVSEIGKGKIAEFGGRVENISRLAAYRAAKASGLSDAAALKRVDKYLFNYKTKNWERPLKAVIPFWSWQKNLTKAAAQLPLDRPFAAKLYNRVDREQQAQYDRDFDAMVPRLKELGYSDAAIEVMRRENAKYFANRLKVGDQYITTPFNPFSENGIGSLGTNPYLDTLAEYGTAKDKYGRPLPGAESSFVERLMQKFPQAGLTRKAYDRLFAKPKTERWIGEPGSGGYGLTKEAQGSDPSKPNYKPSLDKSAKLEQDITAFLGVPRGMKFDTKTFLQRKTMEKLKEEYFAVDWDSLPFAEQEAKRNTLFTKFGVTADDFYKGELSKFDSEDTKKIKKLKDDAFAKTQALFEEYGRQPLGTRNVWATQKLRELVDSGYFASNPFLKSFDWTNPETIAKAQKKIARDSAVKTGDWSEYRSKYPTTGISAKASFWRKYFATSDGAGRRQLLRDNPQYAKGDVKTEQQIADGVFWRKYAEAGKSQRRELLRDNPRYNQRKDWTQKMWDAWKIEQRQQQLAKLGTVRDFAALYTKAGERNRSQAAPVLDKQKRSKNKKLVFSYS